MQRIRSRFSILLPAILISLFEIAYLLLVFCIVRPLHSEGIAQPVLSMLCAIGSLMELPGMVFAKVFIGWNSLHPSTGEWFLILAANTFFIFLGAATGCALLTAQPVGNKREPILTKDGSGAKVAGDSPEKAGVPDKKLSRRRFLRIATMSIAAGASATAGYTFFVEPKRVIVSHRIFPLRGLPPALNGLRALQLSDIHLGPWLSLQFVRKMVQQANALGVDLILLTGDYVHKSPKYIAPVIAALAELQAKIGIVGVLGNHDWWEDGFLSQREFARVGIPLLDNSRMFVTEDRKLVKASRKGLCLAGIGDFWEDEVNFRKALQGVPDDMPRLMLSHNPDAAEEKELIFGGHRIDLMISGHTHGGQISLPRFGPPIVPSRYGQKYAQGLVQGPACPVFVSRGIGMTILPLRIGVSPEIVVIELKAV